MQVLVIDDVAGRLNETATAILREGHDVFPTGSLAVGDLFARSRHLDAVVSVCDIDGISAGAVLSRAAEANPDLVCILIIPKGGAGQSGPIECLPEANCIVRQGIGGPALVQLVRATRNSFGRDVSDHVVFRARPRDPMPASVSNHPTPRFIHAA